jgi:hypothetical protein
MGGRPQLSRPGTHADDDDDRRGLDGCRLFSFVAWDHVSRPGNDFYGGARATDDGVKAAATNAMEVMTGGDGKLLGGAEGIPAARASQDVGRAGAVDGRGVSLRRLPGAVTLSVSWVSFLLRQRRWGYCSSTRCSELSRQHQGQVGLRRTSRVVLRCAAPRPGRCAPVPTLAP